MVENLSIAGTGRGRRLGTAVFLVAIILAAAVVIGRSWPWRPEIKPEPLSPSAADLAASNARGQEQLKSYVGEAACGECHPGESALLRSFWSRPNAP